MAYQINKTDGSVVATVADGQIDQLSTDLTLIGKNFSGFGESINENFVKLLENFASTSQPTRPIRGQLWFDVSEFKLKVYSGLEFLPVSSATISNTQPTSLGIGDLWFNDIDEQLYFYDGTNAILLGPAYTVNQGLSGLKVISILDTLNQTRVITQLYNNGALIGIFSKDSFTPKNSIEGFTGSIVPGFNIGNLAGLKFNVTCTNAEQLGGATATTYVRKDAANSIDGQLRITQDSGIIVGAAGQAQFSVSAGDVAISNTATDRDIIFRVTRGINLEEAVRITADVRNVKIYDNLLDSRVDIGGSLTVEGDLIVKGNTITLNTSEVTIEDKNLILARQIGVTPTDTNASGGGIILQGSDSHVFLWSELGSAATASTPEATAEGYSDALPALLSTAWNSSDHINLATNKYYAIDGIPVIEQTNSTPGNQAFKLSEAVTSIPGVSSFGKQIVITVGPGLVSDNPYLKIENSRISTLAGTGVPANLDLELSPTPGGDIVLFNSPKVIGALTTNDTTPETENLFTADLTELTTKKYVNNLVRARSLVFSMDLTDGKPNSYIITNILNALAPPAEFRNGTVARILCTILTNSSTSLDINSLVNESTSPFLINLSGTTAPAVTNVSVSTATVDGATITTTRIIKEFQLIAGAWVWSSDTILPP